MMNLRFMIYDLRFTLRIPVVGNSASRLGEASGTAWVVRRLAGPEPSKAVTMQSDFNAKAQRRRGAKAESKIGFRKNKALFSDRLRRQFIPGLLRVFAPWRLCVKEFQG
jgi:hypothetical protein